MKQLFMGRGLALALLLVTMAACKKNEVKEDPCKEVSIAGRLVRLAGTDTYTFRTSGGGNIRMELGPLLSIRHIDIMHESYPNFKIELWGDTLVNGVKKTAGNHENLNGKHIKDRMGTTRTVVFPDGAKLTITADGPYGPLQFISIYDGAESHRINHTCNTLIKSSTDAAVAKQLDDSEADGEAAGFEISPTGLRFFNQYMEATPGNRINGRVELGQLYLNAPNQVNDYYDDPRLGHT